MSHHPGTTLFTVAALLVGEVAARMHRSRLQPHTCYDLAGTYPPCCAKTGQPVSRCNGRTHH